jgi:hypothetical protein
MCVDGDDCLLCATRDEAISSVMLPQRSRNYRSLRKLRLAKKMTTTKRERLLIEALILLLERRGHANE